MGLFLIEYELMNQILLCVQINKMAAPDLETQLDEALISNDEERIAHILALMDGSSPVMPAPVSIDCYAHSHYFPGEPLSNLTRENIILLDCGHRI